MDRIKALLGATALHRRRGLKQQTLRKGDMLGAAWVIAVVLIRFTVNCAFAVRELPLQADVGLAITEFDMLHVLLAVFIITFLVSSLSLGAMNLNRPRLGSSPVPFTLLFLAELGSLASNPMNWLVVPFAVPAILPLFLLPHPAPALFTFFFSFAAVYFGAWALSAAFAVGKNIRRLTGLLRVTAALLMLGLVAANFDFQWKGGGVTLYVFQHPSLLTGKGGLLSLLRPWSPSAWIVNAGVVGSPARWVALGLALFLATFAASCLLSLRSFRSPTSKAGVRAWMPLRLGGEARSRTVGGVLFLKEISFLFSSSPVRLGALIAVCFSIWLLAIPDSSINIPILGTVLILSIGFSYPSNAFGNDGPAVRRYVLASMELRRLLLAKNFAYLAASAALLVPLLTAAAIRTSGADVLSLGITSALALSLQLLWGNVSSILAPRAIRRADLRSASEQGTFLNQIFPLLVWGAPIALHRVVAPFGSPVYAAAAFGVFALSSTLYGILLSRASLTDAEEMLGRL